MLAAVSLSTTIIGCGGNPTAAGRSAGSCPAARRSPRRRLRPPSPPAQPPADPVATLIATSQKHFETGERELKLGHLDRARIEFDRAVDVLLESPYGARTDARMREHFDRLIDRISAHEVSALAKGDGFAEKKYEPASIDELLKIATFPKPDADTGDERRRSKQDLAAHRARHPDPAERARPVLGRAAAGAPARLRAGKPDARRRSTCR